MTSKNEKTVTNPEEELVKIKFISGLRDPEAKLRPLDGNKTKPTMSLSKMTESLQFKSQATAFASSSTGNRPFVIKEEVGYNFKKTFRKPSEKFTGNKGNGNLCNRCGGKPHSSKPCPALNKKCNTFEKVGHFSKMCRSETQPKSGKSDQHNNFCEEEGKLPGQTSSEMEMGMYYTRENVFKMSVTWEYITVKDRKIKMQVDTCADSTVISSLIWTELGKPQLNGKVRCLEAYDGHQLTLLGSLTCDVEWNGSKYRQQQLAVVQSDKKFGLLGRDILPQEGINAVSDERIPAVKGYKAHVKLIPGSQPMFCKVERYLYLSKSGSKRSLRQWYNRASWSQYNLVGSKYITISVEAEEKCSSETMRGPQSSHQWQSYGRGLSNPRHGDRFS